MKHITDDIKSFGETGTIDAGLKKLNSVTGIPYKTLRNAYYGYRPLGRDRSFVVADTLNVSISDVMRDWVKPIPSLKKESRTSHEEPPFN